MFVNISCKKCGKKYAINFSESFIDTVQCPDCFFKPARNELENLYHLSDKFATLQHRLHTLTLTGLSSGASSNILIDDLNFFERSYGSASDDMKASILRIIDLVYLLTLRDIQDNNLENLKDLSKVLDRIHQEKCTNQNKDIINFLLSETDSQIDY